MTEKKEIEIVKPKKVAVHDKLIELALSENVGLEKLEKLMDLKERNEANEARKAYHVAMAEFKANPPEIIKDAHVAYKQTEYSHASLANVAITINTGLSNHGLSAAWGNTQDNSTITVTCTITHILGHSESTSLTAGADTSGSKHSIQAIGSTITYLQRYTLLSLAGLAAKGQDDDGAKAEDVEKITESQVADIDSLIQEVGGNKVAFLNNFKVESLADLPLSKYGSAIKLIEAKRNDS